MSRPRRARRCWRPVPRFAIKARRSRSGSTWRRAIGEMTDVWRDVERAVLWVLHGAWTSVR